MHHFPHATGDDAGDRANAGRRKLERASSSFMPPLLRAGCRHLRGRQISEHDLVDHISATFESAGYLFPHSLIVNYYVSLKTNPFVLLTGPAGHGKTEFVQLFAEALVGHMPEQYALIPSNAWIGGTGEAGGFRSLQERFTSLRFLEMLQEAADPTNAGKAYMLCLDALRPDELDFYFDRLLEVDVHGHKRLRLPGADTDQHLVIPANLAITATIDASTDDVAVSPAVLRLAGVIEFRRPHVAASAVANRIAPPPVGYQRLWLRSAVQHVDEGRYRLIQILGAEQFSRLRASPELSRLLWRAGATLSSQTLHDLTTFIANSFDAHGRGLFDHHNPLRNAQLAYDSQVVQRVLWRLRGLADADLRRDLNDYLDRMAPVAPHQAVA